MKQPAAFLLILALALQGCAAAVIPLAAGALMTQRERGANGAAEPAPDPLAPEVVATTELAAPQQEPARPLLPETVEALRKAGLTPGTETATLTALTALPQPGLAAPNAASDPAFDRTYAAFADYALGIAARDPLKDELRPSALLARPGVLLPERAPCNFVGNAVMIDLDPADGPFDPALPIQHTALAAALAQLRDADVEVVWSTALTADRAGDVRGWLKRSGLDPDGKDRLLLLRYPEDRKQTRREEASSERCLIAMLGDERADFDELFDYLRNPDAAVGLDAMLGEGWFLARVSEAAANDEGPQE
jgi:hypothetical protein